MSDLIWTREAPTEPGFYWLRHDGVDADGGVTVAHVTRHLRVSGLLGCHTATPWEGWDSVESYYGAEWAGPIEAPKEAK